MVMESDASGGPRSTPEAPLSPARSLWAGPFRNLFGSAVTSTLGQAISIVSVNWIVFHYTQNAIDVAYVGLAEVCPGIVLGLLAGVLADRYNRRSLMITSDLARMAGMGMLTVILHLLGFSLVVILAVMIAVTSFSAIFTPAGQAILPRLVSKESLEDANGLLFSTSGLGWSVGSAAGGVVVVLFGAVWGLEINSLTYALSAIFLLQILPELGRSVRGATTPRRSLGREFSEGWGYVRTRRSLVEVMFGYLPSNFLSSFVPPFFVVYAAVRFGGSPLAYAALAAALAAGIAGGGLLVGRFETRRVAGLVMGVCLIIEGIAYAGLAVSENLDLSVAATIAAGLTIGFSNTVYYSTIQAVVPSELLARVLSIGDFGSFAAIPAGLVVGGLVVSTYGIGFAVSVAAIGILASGVVLLALPDFRSFGERQPAGS